MIGIYKITNKINNKVYIGETMDVEKRWNEHKESLKNNTHHSYKLQSDWNEYGENNFLFEIIYEVKSYSNVTNLKCFLIISEYRFMKKYNSILNGYNIENTYEKIKVQEKSIFKESEQESLIKAFDEVDKILNINEHIKDEDFNDNLMPLGVFCKYYLQCDYVIKNQEKCFGIIRHILKIKKEDYNRFDIIRYDFDKYIINKNEEYYIKKEIKNEAINRWIYFNINCDTIKKQIKTKKKKSVDKEKFMKYYKNKTLEEVFFEIDGFNFHSTTITLSSFCKSIHIDNTHIMKLVKSELNIKTIKDEPERVLKNGIEIKTIKSEFVNEHDFKTILCNEESKQFLKELIKRDFDENIK